ncbi:MAG: polyprenol monophosphomannose synthase [Victivallales bacterium]
MSIFCSIVIPTYNEKDNIPILLEKLASIPLGKDLEIIVVDDNSPDLTWQVVEEYAKKDSRIHCLRRTHGKGLSPSIVDGFDIAKGEYLCVMDGDLQHDESCLLKMLSEAEKCDLVIGTRYSAGGGIEGGWPIHRRIASSAATLMATMTLGVEVSDPMSGFFIVRASSYRRIRPFLNPRGFKILLEILYLLQIHPDKSEFREVGIFFRKRTAGESKLGFGVMWNYCLSLWQLRRVKIRR